MRKGHKNMQILYLTIAAAFVVAGYVCGGWLLYTADTWLAAFKAIVAYAALLYVATAFLGASDRFGASAQETDR